jgi:hypothetical protein
MTEQTIIRQVEKKPSLDPQAQAAIDRIKSDSKIYTIENDARVNEALKRRAMEMVKAAEHMDMAIFMDQKARPLAYMFHKLWPLIYPDKPRPKIRFVNIGGEKRTLLADYPKKKGIRGQSFLFPIKLLTDIDTLNDVYGSDNIQELSNILEIGKSSTPEKRLFIDDTTSTGMTKELTNRMVEILDPINEYSHFAFIDTPEDRVLFTDPEYIRESGGATKPYLPWVARETLVTSTIDPYHFIPQGQEGSNETEKARFEYEEEHRRRETRESFTTRQELNWLNREMGLEVRRILRNLVAEIKRDRQ